MKLPSRHLDLRSLSAALLVASALAFVSATPAAATDATGAPATYIDNVGARQTAIGVHIIGRENGNGAQCLVGSDTSCQAPGGGGSSAPYVLTPTGFVLVASFSTATGFTPPATSTVCFVTPEGNAVRFRTDGTNPTATVGAPVVAGQQLTLTANLSGTKFIPQTGSATLDVDCYK